MEFNGGPKLLLNTATFLLKFLLQIQKRGFCNIAIASDNLSSPIRRFGLFAEKRGFFKLAKRRVSSSSNFSQLKYFQFEHF